MGKQTNIIFGGDFCPTCHMEEALQKGKTIEDVFGSIVDKFHKADYSVVNLEYPLTKSNCALRKNGSLKKGAPETAKYLKDLKVRLVTLANNHMMDFTEVGLRDTIKTCQNFNIATVGAGLSLSEARQPRYINLNGRSFAFIGVCENEFSVANSEHGGAHGYSCTGLNKLIKQIKSENDFVIVLFHGGSEFVHFPSPETIERYRYIVDCGASAVIGHHPHYIQGYEIYCGAPIIYSLGKLFYSLMDDPEILKIPIATLSFCDKQTPIKVDFDFFKLNLKNIQVERLSPSEQKEVERKFSGLSDALKSPERINFEWICYCKKRELVYLCILLGVPVLIQKILRRLRLMKVIKLLAKIKSKELLTIENFLRCESHNEAAINILERLH